MKPNIFKKCFFSIILLTGLATASFSQSAAKGKVDQSFLNDFVSRNWTTADGLPGMTITAIMQDKKGYIYIGTYDGLVRFDGVEFINYSRTLDPKYAFSSVRAIFQDEAENLWVGHNDEGVSCIKPDGEIEMFNTEAGIPNNSVRAICEDKDHNIWIGTASGLCYITPSKKIVTPNGLAELDQDKILVSHLYCDTAGRIWISTAIENDLFVYSNKKIERFKGITKIKNPSVNEVSQDKTGAFWFGVAPHYAVKIKDNEETVYDVKHDHQEGTVINVITQDSNGDYWIAGDSGLTILHNGNYTYYDKRNGIADDYINEVFQDREGNIWIAYNRGGIEKMSQSKFRTIPMPITVNAICEDKGRNVAWLGTDAGLYCYSDNGFEENKITDFLKGLRIRHVGMTADNELLISTYTDVSQVRVTPDDKITVWTVKEGLAGLKNRVAIKTTTGDYYFGTTVGLSILDHNTGKITSITKDDGLDNEFIMALYEDSRGRIWVGTDGGGLFVLENKKIVKNYTTTEGLSGNIIFKISQLSGKDIWITTGTGLSKYLEETDSFFNYNTSNGLGTDGVFQAIADYTQTIWMTSNKGILSTTLDNLTSVEKGIKDRVSVKTYGASDGLTTGGVTSTSVSMQDSKGRLWFTLIDGFAIYDPIRTAKNQNPPKIDFQTYFMDNVKHDYHGEKIIIEPDVKRFGINFTGLSFISSERIKFRFRLDNFESEYCDWTTNRGATYTNLKPGTYRFIVESQNSDEISSGPSDPIIVIKKPYIWQTIWFWVAVSILSISLLTFLIWLKYHSMKLYQIKLENKVEERTRELKVANEKAHELLLNILPKEVAKELTDHPGQTIAKNFPNATVLFTDIEGFTKLSSGMNAKEVVTMLNQLFSRFDERAKRDGIEKIKTIGDSYMAAAGLTEDADNGGAIKIVKFAQAIMEDVKEFNRTAPFTINMRLGINSGNLVAGVIGKSKFIYDVWGDTVNVASRMESTGEPMKIHVSQNTYNQTKDFFAYSNSVEVQVKGKGLMKSYFL